MIWSLAGVLGRTLPGEAAHRLAVTSLKKGIAPRRDAAAYPQLATRFAGLDLANPIGLAAGFDKDAEAMAGALGLGFGFVEVGTITPLAQPGNPRPRVFRLAEDGAVINRYGFNNGGMIAAAARLARFRQQNQGRGGGIGGGIVGGIVGVNIGANKDSRDRHADYYDTAEKLAPYADYITVNVSSPNTPGLRALQHGAELKQVLDAATAGMVAGGAMRPLVLKIAPDLDESGLVEALEAALDHGLAAVIIANTTIARPPLLKSRYRDEAGGLSGQPLFNLSTAMLSRAANVLRGRLPLIAAGGVDDAVTAYAKILAGASLVQLYTGLAIKGALLPSAILDGLAVLLNEDGHTALDAAIGSMADAEQAIAHARAVNARAVHAGKVAGRVQVISGPTR